MVTAYYRNNEDQKYPSFRGSTIIIDNRFISMEIDLDDAESLIDSLRQILREHPEE
jgi:hypothetical protein